MKHLLKFNSSWKRNHIRMDGVQVYPCIGVDTVDSTEGNIYISENPSHVLLDSNFIAKVHCTRYYGNGSSFTNGSSNEISRDELRSGQSQFNLNATPHVLSLYLIAKGEPNSLFTSSVIDEGLVTTSGIVMPSEVINAQYSQIQYIYPEYETLNMVGWRGTVITIYSYNGEPESFDDIPTFQEGQQITFNLTMKKPNGEIILDNKAITLNFT